MVKGLAQLRRACFHVLGHAVSPGVWGTIWEWGPFVTLDSRGLGVGAHLQVFSRHEYCPYSLHPTPTAPRSTRILIARTFLKYHVHCTTLSLPAQTFCSGGLVSPGSLLPFLTSPLYPKPPYQASVCLSNILKYKQAALFIL